MNIEEAIEYLKNCLNDEYNFKNATRKKDKQAIETLLTAYEKEKEKNKDARERIEYYLVGNFALNDFDKRDKELRKIEKILEE